MNNKSIVIKPKKLKGKVSVPPSKSLSHRGIVCAGLSNGVSIVDNLIYSEDISTTIDAMKKFGMVVINEENVDGRYRLTLQNPKMSEFKCGKNALIDVPEIIDCNESGTTIRFLMPFFTLSNSPMTFTGKGRLGERPYETFYKILRERNIPYKTTDGLLPVTIDGKLEAGVYEMAGNVSSQFISGLMLVLPLLNGSSEIKLTTNLESKGYVDLTLDVCSKFGIEIKTNNPEHYVIKGNQIYKSSEYTVEGDYSQAAFWLVAACLGNEVVLRGMQPNSLQGDRAILDIVEAIGGKIIWNNEDLTASHNGVNGVVVDASQCPDLVPVVTVLLSLCKGTSEIVNAGRLRIKESDRLKAICTELNKMGAKVVEREEGLLIEGIEKFKGAVVDSWNDHRIAMAIAIAATCCDGDVELTGYEAVKKSYPMFWEDYEKLGGCIHAGKNL